MKTAQKVLVLAGVTVGLITGTGTGTAFAATPVTSVAPTSVAAPMDRGDHDGDHKGRNGGDRGRDHKDWKGGNDRWRGDHGDHNRRDNHRWRWDWRDYRHHHNYNSYNSNWFSVSPSKCRSGGGHVENHWCENGRYDGRWVRF